ncbi:DUF2479 domain-containing protein [Listeria monocytogenes]|nr:DUF2479 domain-containing protein [Listeria monocytogenes]EAG8714014.1 DUF2479 domain-containing protein [Listeria monocytogenes]EAG8732385.1 DUF2479 domain-containing protein [Listeria monocytogenes]
MATNEVIVLSIAKTNYVGSLVIRRNDFDTPTKAFKFIKLDGTPFDFTGFSPVFETRSPAGMVLRDYNYDDHIPFQNINTELGTLDYTFSNAIYNEPGEYQLAYIVFEKWDEKRESMLNRESTQNFSFNVIEDAYAGSPTPQNSISDWIQLLEQYQSWRKELEVIVFADKERILAELDRLIISAEDTIAKNDEAFSEWFEQMKDTLGSDPATALQSQMNQLLPTEEIYTVTHNNMSYPKIRQVTFWNYGIGTTGLGEEPDGKFGGTNRTEIPFKVEYLDMNVFKLYVPFDFKVSEPTSTQLVNENILLVDGIKSIEIEME